MITLPAAEKLPETIDPDLNLEQIKKRVPTAGQKTR